LLALFLQNLTQSLSIVLNLLFIFSCVLRQYLIFYLIL
jgi:hypothetical protein